MGTCTKSVQLFNKLLLSTYYLLSTIERAKKAMVHKTGKSLCFHGTYTDLHQTANASSVLL